jgi:hypothetical protein
VKAFQAANGLAVDGEVGENTFPKLVAPVKKALEPIAPDGRSLGQMVVAYANQHLKQKPREAPNDNMGPWVRLYMDGAEGDDAKWCAGFVCFCLQQACTALGAALPIEPSVSCDALAVSAKTNGVFLTKPPPEERGRITPGGFLLLRDKPIGKHVGIVVKVGTSAIESIEGNTNAGGSVNGIAVLARKRPYDENSMDYVLIP